MPTVSITLELPEELVNDARRLALLTDSTVAELIQAEIERRRAEEVDEAEWEESVIIEALGDALKRDGTLDFDKLNARTDVVTLEELHSEVDNDES